MRWDSYGFPIDTMILSIVSIITIINTVSTMILVITSNIVNLNANTVMTTAHILICRVLIVKVRTTTSLTIAEKLSFLLTRFSYVYSHYFDSSMENPEPHGRQAEPSRRRIILGISSGYSRRC